MASKVNTKFILILAVAIVALVAGAGGLFVFSQLKSAERNITQAEELEAEAQELLTAGDEAEAYELRQQAMAQRGAAVNKQRTNIEYLEGWRDSILRTRPDSPDRYRDNFNKYFDAVRVIADLRPNDLESQLDILDAFLDRVRRAGPGATAQFATFVEAASDRIDRFRLNDEAARNILRGYRGWGRTQLMLATSVDREQRQRAKEDLDAAIQAARTINERGDLERAPELERFFAAGRIQWVAGETRTSLAGALPAQARDTFREERPVVGDLAGRYPDSIRVQSSLLLYELSNPDVRALTDNERQQRQQRINTLVGNLFDAAQQTEPGELGVFELQQSLRFGAPQGRTREFIEFVRSVPERLPEDPAALSVAAATLRNLNDLNGARDMFLRIIDMPLPEVSMEGVDLLNRRVVARFELANLGIDRYRLVGDADARAAALEEAKQYRDEAEQVSGVAFENELNYINAEINLLEDNYREARAGFSRVQAEEGRTERVLAGLARCAAALGNTDAAVGIYTELLQNRPLGPGGGVDALFYTLELADVFARSGNVPAALELVEAATDLIDAPALQQREAQLRALVAEQIRSELADAQREAAENPRNADSAERVQELTQQLDEVAGDADLPEDIRIIGEAQRVAEARGNEAGIAVIEQGLRDYPDSRALNITYIAGLFSAGDPRTPDAIDTATQRFPDDPAVAAWRTRWENRDRDPYTVAREAIESDDSISEPLRQSRIARLAMSYGRRDEAEQASQRAIQADSENPQAVEVAFTLAISETPPDLDRAEELRTTAAAIDADNLDGLTFDARLAAARGDIEDAIDLYRQATERIPSEPALWRQLGVALNEAGRPAEAVEAFETALGQRSDDLRTVQAYASTLQRLGRPREALEAIGRDSPVFERTRRIPDLRHLWLQLEAAVGDTEFAIERRRQRFESNPNEGRNTSALFDLYANTERFQAANELIDTLENDPEALEAFAAAAGADPQLALARSRAILIGAQGDREGAIDFFEQQLPALADRTNDATPHVSFADFVLAIAAAEPQLTERAFDALERGRQVQSASRLEADVAIAQNAQQRVNARLQLAARAAQQNDTDAVREHQQRAQELRRLAAQANQRIIDSGVVSGEALDNSRIRLARILIQLGENQQARTALQTVLSQSPDNLQALLLKADLDQRDGNTEAARQALDDAVAAHPNDFRPFRSRAILNRDNPELFADVIADLDQVHRLQPADTVAWRLRLDVMLRRAEANEVFARLNQAIENNPAAAPALRRTLVDLYAISRQRDQATEVAISYADEDTADLFWQQTAGRLAAEAGRYRAAERTFRRLYEAPSVAENPDRRAAAAAGLLDALLRNQAAPLRGDILELLRALEPLEDDDNTAITMLRARAHAAMDERDTALSLIQQGLDAAGNRVPDLRTWREALTLAIGEDGAARYVSRLNRTGQAPAFLRLADLRQRVPELSRSELVEQTRELVRATTELGNDALTVEVAKFAIPVFYGTDNFQEAVDLGKRALEIAPNDSRLNNDTAYILASEFGRYDEALTYAERAYATAQDDAAILDTVGTIYRGVGRTQQAAQILEQARTKTRNQDLLLPINIHLAEAHNDLGNRQAATDALDEARRLARRASQGVRSRYQADIDALAQQLQ